MLSNGPGDPAEVTDIIAEVKKLSEKWYANFRNLSWTSVNGSCLRLQDRKLKYGHHGANHPVKDLDTNRVYISTQNHNYVNV